MLGAIVGLRLGLQGLSEDLFGWVARGDGGYREDYAVGFVLGFGADSVTDMEIGRASCRERV